MAATPFDPILDKSRDLMSERADATFAELIEKTPDTEAQGMLTD